MNAQTAIPEVKTREMSYAEAIRDAMAIALERDPTVILMGEDIGVYGGAFQVTGDLVERFGTDRVMDTPISELGGAGVAVGKAFDVEADHVTAVGDDVATVALDEDGGANADVFPVGDFAGAELGDDELPEEFAGLFVEAHEHAAVTDLLGVAWRLVVGADKDAAAGDDGGAVGL